MRRAHAIGCALGLGVILGAWGMAFLLLWGSVRGLR